MTTKNSYQNLIQEFDKALENLPDYRTGENTVYEIKDAALGAFAMFFMQSPSFLSYQRTLKKKKGRSNAETLFGIEKIPSNNQIRNLLDPQNPEALSPVFATGFQELEREGKIESYRSYQDNLLISCDGTNFFSSKKIHCEKCSRTELENGETNYSHSGILPLIAKPGENRVIHLEPEFIVPQDGHEKQDCEREGMKRWLRKHGEHYSAYGGTILGDDLYCNQVMCENILDAGFDFILVCKPDSHKALYEMIDFLEANGGVEEVTVRSWNGRFVEIYTYRFVNQVPIRRGEDALLVNWCELTITKEEDGKVLYKNAFATNFQITEENVRDIVRDGRTRWKSENEGNNNLKTKGYHLEHNFGHGKEYLANFLLTLNLLAYLFHTVLAFLDDKYKKIREELVRRDTFFNDLRALTRYMVFDSWSHLLRFMMIGLELIPGAEFP